MNTRFSRSRRSTPHASTPAPAPAAAADPVLLPPERPVEQPAPGSHGLRTMLLAAAGGVGLGVVSWFGVLPAVTGGGDTSAEALPPSSMAVLAPSAPAGDSTAGGGPAKAGPAPRAVAPHSPEGGAAPSPGGPAPSPRNPFVPLQDDGEPPATTPEPVVVVPDPASATAPATPAAAPAASPSPTPGRPVAGSVEFTGEPVTFRLLTTTTGSAQEPGQVRATLDGLVVELSAGDSVAALKLLAAGDPCAAFELGTAPFVLCEGQERTLSFG